MAWLDLLARKFAAVLNDPNFGLDNLEPYVNQYGCVGVRYTGKLNERVFYVSQSGASVGFWPPKKIARIIMDSSNLDRRKSLIYLNQKLEPGLRIEAWYCRRWCEVWTPTTSQPMDDFFARFASEHANEE